MLRSVPRGCRLVTRRGGWLRRRLIQRLTHPWAGRYETEGVAPGSMAGVGGIESLLVLQGEEDPAQRRRRTAKRGVDILDSLDRLKAAILSGRIPAVDLLRIRGLLNERRDLTDDPRLDEVLAHIELRAAVELAKLGR